MNQVVLIGRLTKAPELKYTQSNKAVCSFTIAVNRITKGEADFISCQAWDKTAELVSKYFDKGNQIAVSGKIQTRKYDDHTGKTHYITEVIVNGIDFIGAKKDDAPLDAKTTDDDELPF